MIQQIYAVTAMNLRSIPSRLGTSAVIVIGIAGVVGVMVALLAMGAGFQATLASTGEDDRAIVMRSGSLDELSSVVIREHAAILAETPGVASNSAGEPLAIGELFMLTNVAKRDAVEPNNVVVRGTTPQVLKLRHEARLVEGRMFQPGVREVVVGIGAQRQFSGLQIGDLVEVREGAWPIVGVFETGGDVHESEIWVDREALVTASRRSAWNSVTVQLEDAASFTSFKDAITSDPRLKLQVQREPDYYASRSEAMGQMITGLGYTVAVIMGIGALFGALNTMYAAVATRTVEIATLRALGFGSVPVVISVLLEALVLALLGALIGGALAYLFFNGYSVSTLNFQTFSQVAFAFRVSGALLVQGMIVACLIGLVGGLFPAVRAARMPVADALRAS
ncbi:ABC transporter permease [Oceanococcus atlanticus]|uniref:ABC transporter permease n=1 Tax=Oceanococcus atlanticus TaxID=1317117 RepID=A0A1Y1SCM9_9GAMM|nr:ABC transporter permease [Oceanococcus atlanticus]ORE86382.1 ABC transporter permease [Oceanococcus atlanticus]